MSSIALIPLIKLKDLQKKAKYNVFMAGNLSAAF